VVLNTSNGKKVKIPRLVRMHSSEMVETESAKVPRSCPPIPPVLLLCAIIITTAAR
jgi:hypothetical protein